ncbi:Flp family type IVb pilin [Geomicrobium sp. JSM 1781026]|uniref:Flp family type IVb pilin n=1 Tax=Geomicrobium sp. JSM 1781026 TaxID=3344580 RepID=UPI0035C23A17
MIKVIKSFWKEEEGQSLSEYGLILALVAVAVITALTLLGSNLTEMFNDIAEQIMQ